MSRTARLWGDFLQKVDEAAQELLHEGRAERGHLDAHLKLRRLDLDGDSIDIQNHQKVTYVTINPRKILYEDMLEEVLTAQKIVLKKPKRS